MPLITNPIIIGSSPTDTQNFRLQSGNDGTLTLARKSDGSGGDILTVDATGDVKLTKTANTSMVRLNTANGYGSTNTMIRRFTNVVTNQGTDITYADSATLGATFTINTNGVYAISYTDCYSTAGAHVGISLDSNQLTTAIWSITASNNIASSVLASINNAVNCGATLYLPSGSVIRPHTTGVATGTSVNTIQFTITRVA